MNESYADISRQDHGRRGTKQARILRRDGFGARSCKGGAPLWIVIFFFGVGCLATPCCSNRAESREWCGLGSVCGVPGRLARKHIWECLERLRSWGGHELNRGSIWDRYVAVVLVPQDFGEIHGQERE